MRLKMKSILRKIHKYQSFLPFIALLFFISVLYTNPGCHSQCKNEKHKKLEKNNTLFQYSTLKALLEGLYDGDLSIGQLKKYGTIGMGTFNTLDGEMVVLDGEVFRIKADGNAYAVKDDDKTPFAVVTHFETDHTAQLEEKKNYQELQEYLNTLLPSKNIIYAFQIEGKFSYVKTRSVPAQKKPYPHSSEILKNQPIFEFQDVEGYMVGFLFPSSLGGANLPSYHFHFITSDKKRGGHVLECETSVIEIKIDHLYRYKLIFPSNEDFLKKDLEETQNKEYNLNASK